MKNIVETIKNNLSILNNKNKSRAYANMLDETLPDRDNQPLPSLSNLVDDLIKDINYRQIDKPAGRLATGVSNFQKGFNENFHTPLNPENLQRVEGKTFGTKLGEFMGTASRFLDSPLGRMAIMGGITALGGGTPLETIRYGIGAGALNQALRNQDSMYRQELLNSGVPKENLDNIKGYISPQTYNNYVKGQYMHDNTDIERNYKSGMLDIYQQNADTDREYKTVRNDIENRKNFVPAEQYYKALLEQGFIDEEQFGKITNSPEYDPYELINLNLQNVVVGKQKAFSKAQQVEDDIKTNRQKRYFLNKNGGKQVMKVEYGKKPVENTVMDINYHYDDNVPDSKRKRNGKNSAYNNAYNKFLPDSKKRIVF